MPLYSNITAKVKVYKIIGSMYFMIVRFTIVCVKNYFIFLFDVA